MLSTKTRICSRSIACFLALGIAGLGNVRADQTYDQTNPSHVWDNSTQNWDNSTSAWLSGNAIFTGTAQSVDVNGAIIVGNITFNSNGWNIADPTTDGTLNFGPTSTISIASANNTEIISAPIASGALSKAGVGILTLSGNNTFSGDVNVTAGILNVGSNTTLGDTTGVTNVTANAAVVLANGVTVTGETISLKGNGPTSATNPGNPADFVGALQAAAGATATWAGTVTLDDSGVRVGAGDGGVLILSGVIQNGANNVLGIGSGTLPTVLGTVIVSGTLNTYTGATQIIRGVLKLGASNALPIGTTLDVDQTSATEDSIFDLAGFNQAVGLLQRSGSSSGTGGSFITNSGATTSTLTVNETSATSYSGVIKDGAAPVALTKSGGSTLTLTGANTYTGPTSITAGTLSLTTGSLTGTAITVSAGVLSEASGGVIGGASSIAINSGTSLLNGTNGYTGLTSVSGTSTELDVNNNLALGTTAAGTTVGNGARIVLGNNINVTGETLTMSGSGGNNNGALQTALGATAEWTGNIVIALDASRLGAGAGGTLTISGVISTTGTFNSILFSRADSSTTILNAVNTYTADTQIFANAGSGDTLKINVDNAINAGSRLSVITTVATVAMTLDLNGHILTLRGLDTQGSLASGAVQFVANNGATPTVLTLTEPTAANTAVFAGVLKDGTSGTGGISLVKNGAGTQFFIGNETYTGSTTVNAGTLQIGGSFSTLGTNGALASTNITLNGGTFAVNNAGASNNNLNRISDSATFTMKGGALVFTGSGVSNSSETVGTFALNSGLSRITATSGGLLATVTAGQLTHTANSGIALVNGIGLGKDNTSNVGRIVLTTPPSLIGTAAALNTGINLGVVNTQIVPYLLGEATAATGGVGTITGTPNTFVTYEASTGLRPLNLADEFTQNAFASTNNIRLTANTNAGSSVAINSLVLEGASASITSNQTLTVSSGAILFSTGTGLGITNGTLAFGANEGIVTINSGGNTTISAVITGSNGVSYYGSGTLVLATQQNTYDGSTLLQVGTAIPQSSSMGPAGAPTSGPFGKGTLILGGSSMRATNASSIVIGNPVTFAADTTIIAGSADKTLSFTGPVTLTGNRTLTQNSTANTILSGNIGDGGSGFGLTFTGTGVAPVVLSGASSYTGTTAVKGGTVVVSGSLSGSSPVVVGDAANLSKVAVIGGAGTVGNVTVGAAAGNTGASLAPHAGSASTTSGTTFHANNVTFANSAAHLTLQLGRTGAFTGAAGDGTAGGDVSDHLSTTGALTLNGVDLQLILSTGYTPANGDVFFLTINSGGAINGTFSSLNGTATDLSEGAVFYLSSQTYQMTYLANFSGNSFTGGHDVAVVAVIPEPGTLVSLLGGLGCLLGAQRFRRSRQSRRNSSSGARFMEKS